MPPGAFPGPTPCRRQLVQTKGSTAMTIVPDRRPRQQPRQQPRQSGPEREVPRPGWLVGVDTHTDTHTAALVDHLGGLHAEIQAPAAPAGYAQLLGWAAGLVPAGQRLRWSVEGTRSHGQGLTRHLLAAGHTVYEAPKPVNSRRRPGGEAAPIDAVHAARAALAIDQDPTTHHAIPRADGHREALRILLVTRRHDTDQRTATINLFKSLLLGATGLPEHLRELSTARQVRTIRDLPDLPEDPPIDLETRIRLQALRHTAAMITELNRAVYANEKHLR